jgi:hypothetical protein
MKLSWLDGDVPGPLRLRIIVNGVPVTPQPQYLSILSLFANNSSVVITFPQRGSVILQLNVGDLVQIQPESITTTGTSVCSWLSDCIFTGNTNYIKQLASIRWVGVFILEKKYVKLHNKRYQTL